MTTRLRFADVVSSTDTTAVVTVDGVDVTIPTTGTMTGVGAVLQQGRLMVGLGVNAIDYGGPTANLLVIHWWRGIGAPPDGPTYVDSRGRTWHRVNYQSGTVGRVIWRQVAGPSLGVSDATVAELSPPLSQDPAGANKTLSGRSYKLMRVVPDTSLARRETLMDVSANWYAPSSNSVWRTAPKAITSEGNYGTLLVGEAASRVSDLDPALGKYPAGNRMLLRQAPNLYGNGNHTQTMWVGDEQNGACWHPSNYEWTAATYGAGFLAFAEPYEGPTWIYTGHNGGHQLDAWACSSPAYGSDAPAPGDRPSEPDTGEVSTMYTRVAKGDPISTYASGVTDQGGSLWWMGHNARADFSIGTSFMLCSGSGSGGAEVNFTTTGARGWSEGVFNYGIVTTPEQTVAYASEQPAYGVGAQVTTDVTTTNVGGGFTGDRWGWDQDMSIGTIYGTTLSGPYGGSGSMPETLNGPLVGHVVKWASPHTDTGDGRTVDANYTTPPGAFLIRDPVADGGTYTVWVIPVSELNELHWAMRPVSSIPSLPYFPNDNVTHAYTFAFYA